MNTYTRKDLISLGLTKYLATKLTEKLTPAGKQGRANTYNLTDLIYNTYLPAKPATQAKLKAVQGLLHQQLKSRLDQDEQFAKSVQKVADKVLKLSNNVIVGQFQ